MNRIENDWKFLENIWSLLAEQNVQIIKDEGNPVVRFEYPEDLRKIINFKITENGIDDLNAIKEICRQIIHYSVQTGHPHFHNQLFAGLDPFGLAGSWITDALNTSQYTYEVGPVFTLMENEIIQMFCQKFGYKSGDGIFSPGGSLSNFYGMVLAKFRAVPNIKQTGLFGCKPLVAFTSDESHYSIRKAVNWLGIGIDNLISIKCNERGQMILSDLEEKIQQILSENKQPFFVNATAGTTVFAAFDDFNGIADICSKYNLWMHVDACLGGSLILSSSYKHRLAGLERSDSISWNPHKSLGVPLQCSLFLIQQKGLLHECNSADAQYLFQQDKFYDVSYDTGDKSVQCGRKVDVFKFWLMLKARGLSAFEELIDNSMEISKYLTDQVIERPGFRLVCEQRFEYTNVCFWYIPEKIRELPETEEWWTQVYSVVPVIKEKMMKKGTMMVGYTPLTSKNLGNFFRMVFTCFPPPTKSTADFVLDEIERLGEEI